MTLDPAARDSDWGRPRGPTAILYLTGRCNQACIFCLESDVMPDVPEPAFAEVVATLEALHARGCRSATFMGAETLLRGDVPEILREATRIGYRDVCIATNGTLLARPGFLAKLRAAGLYNIEFSLHGHEAGLVDSITGRRNFERQMEGLARMEEEGLRAPIVNVVVCRQNAATLGEIPRLVRRRFPRMEPMYRFKFMSRFGRGRTVDDAVRYEDVDAVDLGNRMADEGFRAWFEGFPLCRLGPHASSSFDVVDTVLQESYFNLDFATNRYEPSPPSIGKGVHPEAPCSRCPAQAICPGLQANYWETFGAPDLHPIEAPIGILLRCAERLGRDPRGERARLEAILASAPAPRRPVPVTLRPPESPDTPREVREIGPFGTGASFGIGTWTVEGLEVSRGLLRVKLASPDAGTVTLMVSGPRGNAPSGPFQSGDTRISYEPTEVPFDVVRLLGEQAARAVRAAAPGGSAGATVAAWISAVTGVEDEEVAAPEPDGTGRDATAFGPLAVGAPLGSWRIGGMKVLDGTANVRVENDAGEVLEFVVVGPGGEGSSGPFDVGDYRVSYRSTAVPNVRVVEAGQAIAAILRAR